jgi:hypothetical protein
MIQHTASTQWASAALNSDAVAALPQLEAAMQVRLMATTPFDHCYVEEDVAAVLARFSEKDYDHIPVRDGHHVVGVFNCKEGHPSSSAMRDVMQPLTELWLLSADTPLLSFIERADERPYCLVLDGEMITGIVTLSDLQKLPVRPAIFLLITHLELLIGNWLRGRKEEEWLGTLDDVSRKRIRKAFKELKQENLALDLVTSTTFSDKYRAAVALKAFPEASAKKDLEEICKLRNSIAHAWEYGNQPDCAKTVARRVRLARQYIKKLG